MSTEAMHRRDECKRQKPSVYTRFMQNTGLERAEHGSPQKPKYVSQ